MLKVKFNLIKCEENVLLKYKLYMKIIVELTQNKLISK